MNMSNGHKHREPAITITSAEASVKSSLIVVSNRLPFVLKKNAEGKMVRQARWVRLTFCGDDLEMSSTAPKRRRKKSVDKVCRLQSPLRRSISGCDRVTQKSASIAQHRKKQNFSAYSFHHRYQRVMFTWSLLQDYQVVLFMQTVGCDLNFKSNVQRLLALYQSFCVKVEALRHISVANRAGSSLSHVPSWPINTESKSK